MRHPKQIVLSQVIKKQINNFHDSPRTESKSETGSFKLTSTQKIALKTIAETNGVKVSQLINNSIEFYLDFLPHVDTLMENFEAIEPLLERLR